MEADPPAAPHLHQVLEKTFEIGHKGRLVLSLPRAAVHLQPGPPEKIKATIRAAGSDLHEAHALIEQIDLKARLQGGTVKVESAPITPATLSEWGGLPSPALRVDISLPTNCHVDATTYAGALHAERLTGRIILSASGGTLQADDLDGRIELYANAARVDLAHLTGKQLHLHANSSDVTLRQLATQHATLRLASTEGRLHNVSSTLQLYLNDASATVQGIEGRLEAESYSSELNVHLAEAVEMNLHAAAGTLDLHVPATLSSRLSLQAEQLSFEAPLSFSGRHSGHRVEGSLNGGGVPVTARAVCGHLSCHVD